VPVEEPVVKLKLNLLAIPALIVGTAVGAAVYFVLDARSYALWASLGVGFVVTLAAAESLRRVALFLWPKTLSVDFENLGSLEPFQKNHFGIVVPHRPRGVSIVPWIREVAEGTPLAAFIKIREASSRHPEALNASAVLRESSDLDSNEMVLQVIAHPPRWSESKPRVFFAELDEWPITQSGQKDIARFIVAWALYCKQFYREAIDIVFGLDGFVAKVSVGSQYLCACAALRIGGEADAEAYLSGVGRTWDRRLYPDRWMRVEHSRALAAFQSGLPGEAVSISRALLEVRTIEQHRVGWSYTANNLALALAQLGQTDEARHLLLRAAETLEQAGSPGSAQRVRENLVDLEAASTTSSARELSSELLEARRQINQLIGIPEGPFIRPKLRIAHRLNQATSISGDFYGIVPRQDGSIAIYLVDVEGHGVKASSTAVAIGNTLTRSGLNWGTGDPHEEMERADALVEDELRHADVAVCMNFLEVDPYSGRIRYANAGMPAPLLFHVGESQPEALQAVGMYVGNGYRRTRATPAEVTVTAKDGDVLLMFTDGIPEAVDQRGRPFGQSGIIAAVSRAGLENPEAIADEVLRAVHRYTGKTLPDDDQAILVLQIGDALQGVGKTEVRTLTLLKTDVDQTGLDVQREYELVNAVDTGEVSTTVFKDALLEWTASWIPSLERRREIWGATWEAIKNAIKHGSELGDVVQIKLSAQTDPSAYAELRRWKTKEELSMLRRRIVKVAIAQPLRWTNWDEKLGTRRRSEAKDFEKNVGTLMILLAANEVHVTDQGRRVEMSFAEHGPGVHNGGKQI
jgi:serine phosphatase RsbU (regulator of sigma subunit)